MGKGELALDFLIQFCREPTHHCQEGESPPLLLLTLIYGDWGSCPDSGPGQALCWNSCSFHRGSSRFLGRERLVCKAPGSGQTGHRSGQASFLDSAPDPTPSSPMGRPGCCPVCRLVFTLCLLFARIPRFSFTCWGPSSRHGPRKPSSTSLFSVTLAHPP